MHPSDLPALHQYLVDLKHATRQRFGPHPFEWEPLNHFFTTEPVAGFGAWYAKRMIAYTVIRQGLVPHDRERLLGYHYPLEETYCCTLAPCVTDDWQGRGIGTILFDYVQAQLQAEGIRQLILWGGVQSTNLAAQGFYRKKGFIRLGSFEYHGWNDDMLLEMGREF